MTYYDYVNYIEDLKDKTITDDIINKINNFNLDYPIDIINRIVDHFLTVIYFKLNDIDDNLDTSLNNIKTPQELTLQINNINKTLNDVKKLLNIKYLDQELTNYIKDSMFKYANDYKETIKKHFSGTTSNDYIAIIKNIRFLE